MFYLLYSSLIPFSGDDVRSQDLDAKSVRFVIGNISCSKVFSADRTKKCMCVYVSTYKYMQGYSYIHILKHTF